MSLISNIKYQISNIQTKYAKIFIFLICIFAFCFLIFGFISCGYAKEIIILYTGETHAMLYPCSCPEELDGGIARRASLIKELKKNNPNTLVLDSGGFFASGLMDEYTQNTELDKERTIINLKAMELARYNALAIGDDEFNFGRGFLEENITRTNLAFLSCNIESELFKPYLVKEVAGTKIGIIGVTGLFAMQKAGGLKVTEPKLAVKAAVEELKKNGANIIVLLSHLGENEDLRLIEEVEGIDILLVGHSRSREEPSSKIGSTLILRPSWQGHRLGKLSLTVTDNKITDYKAEELRLSDKISDDPDVLTILPRCFSDANCKKAGFIGVCVNSGTLNSQCSFSEPTKINLSIILPKLCRVCNTETIANYLKTQFPGLVISYLYYPEAKANKLIRDFGIKGLPVYLLDKEIEKEKGFISLRGNLERKGVFYILKPQFSGLAYFLDRERIKGKLDLFMSLYDINSAQILDVIKEFNPQIHFLAVQQQDMFDAAKGSLEVEEYLRSVCVQKYYPEKFWDYISCRVKSIDTSWWEDCASNFNIDKIKTCARGEEGKTLLKENISLNKELQIVFGPTYVLDNLEIFTTQGVPSKEELKKLMKR